MMRVMSACDPLRTSSAKVLKAICLSIPVPIFGSAPIMHNL
jgi:hypothetical protein